MKPVKSKMKIHLSDGRITNANVLDDGTCELTVAVDNNVEVQNIEGHKDSKVSNVSKNDAFVLVEASKLSCKDEFMQYEPTSDNQRKFKKLLTKAIKSGLSDFWHSKLDPSFNEERNGLVFEAGKMPAVGKSYNWWEEKARQYLPERGSRLGTKKEYIAFLGILIKSLVASGWSMSKAWEAVCDDSRELGHYWNSENARHDFEPTGSRENSDFCDLANTYKILAEDEETGGFLLAGGNYYDNSNFVPLASLCRDTSPVYVYGYSVGWLVLSK